MKPIFAAVGLALSTTLIQVALGLAASAAEEPSVLVDVSNVAEQLAEQLSVGPERIPPGVEMPIEAASEVCAATPDMLAYAGSGGQQIGCEATEISDDLIRALNEQLDLRKNSTGNSQRFN